MKILKELKKESPEQLQKLLVLKGEALRSFRFNLSGSKTKNVREGRNLRRTIARIHTLLYKHGNSK